MENHNDFIISVKSKLLAYVNKYNINTNEDLNEIVNFVISIGIDININDIKYNQRDFKTVTYSGSSNNAKSRKITNIKFNIIDLLEVLAESTITVIGIYTYPVLAIIAFLIAIRKACKSISIKINPNDAIILYSIWKSPIKNKNFKIKDIYKYVKKEFKFDKKIKKKEIIDEIKSSLERLNKLGCISFNKNNEEYKIIEKISFKGDMQ